MNLVGGEKRKLMVVVGQIETMDGAVNERRDHHVIDKVLDGSSTAVREQLLPHHQSPTPRNIWILYLA